MPKLKRKIIRVLEKNSFTRNEGRRHTKFSKKIKTRDNKKHKIVTNVDRHNELRPEIYNEIAKQVVLNDKIEESYSCNFTKQDYENKISNMNKAEFSTYTKR